MDMLALVPTMVILFLISRPSSGFRKSERNSMRTYTLDDRIDKETPPDSVRMLRLGSGQGMTAGQGSEDSILSEFDTLEEQSLSSDILDRASVQKSVSDILAASEISDSLNEDAHIILEIIPGRKSRRDQSFSRTFNIENKGDRAKQSSSKSIESGATTGKESYFETSSRNVGNKEFIPLDTSSREGSGMSYNSRISPEDVLKGRKSTSETISGETSKSTASGKYPREILSRAADLPGRLERVSSGETVIPGKISDEISNSDVSRIVGTGGTSMGYDQNPRGKSLQNQPLEGMLTRSSLHDVDSDRKLQPVISNQGSSNEETLRTDFSGRSSEKESHSHRFNKNADSNKGRTPIDESEEVEEEYHSGGSSKSRISPAGTTGELSSARSSVKASHSRRYHKSGDSNKGPSLIDESEEVEEEYRTGGSSKSHISPGGKTGEVSSGRSSEKASHSRRYHENSDSNKGRSLIDESEEVGEEYRTGGSSKSRISSGGASGEVSNSQIPYQRALSGRKVVLAPDMFSGETSRTGSFSQIYSDAPITDKMVDPGLSSRQTSGETYLIRNSYQTPLNREHLASGMSFGGNTGEALSKTYYEGADNRRKFSSGETLVERSYSKIPSQGSSNGETIASSMPSGATSRRDSYSKVYSQVPSSGMSSGEASRVTSSTQHFHQKDSNGRLIASRISSGGPKVRAYVVHTQLSGGMSTGREFKPGMSSGGIRGGSYSRISSQGAPNRGRMASGIYTGGSSLGGSYLIPQSRVPLSGEMMAHGLSTGGTSGGASYSQQWVSNGGKMESSMSSGGIPGRGSYSQGSIASGMSTGEQSRLTPGMRNSYLRTSNGGMMMPYAGASGGRSYSYTHSQTPLNGRQSTGTCVGACSQTGGGISDGHHMSSVMIPGINSGYEFYSYSEESSNVYDVTKK